MCIMSLFNLNGNASGENIKNINNNKENFLENDKKKILLAEGRKGSNDSKKSISFPLYLAGHKTITSI